jgi:hypothetical protein
MEEGKGGIECEDLASTEPHSEECGWCHLPAFAKSSLAAPLGERRAENEQNNGDDMGSLSAMD